MTKCPELQCHVLNTIVMYNDENYGLDLT